MLPLSLTNRKDKTLNVLCLGAHCDDIEIGCGATLLTLLGQNLDVNVYWQVFTSTPSRKQEAIAGAEYFASKASQIEVDIRDFRDGYLPYEGSAVKEAMEETKSNFVPDVIFTHYRKDLHQDHRKISELTWNTFRDHLILEYEIPKWDGDMGAPNVFVAIDEVVADDKISALQSIYNSQNAKGWFSDDLFHSIMRIRGMESNSASGLAEAFYARKVLFDVTA
jgi:LmbE family N-acetylglucosaminyl deacetylase